MPAPQRYPVECPQYGLFEHVLTTEEVPELPFRAELYGTMTRAGGRAPAAGREETTLRVPLFYDGEATYRLRFSPEAPGAWDFRIEAPAGMVLHGETEGAFTCTPSAARGPLRRAPEPHHFRYADGARPFILGNTAYNLVACYRRSPEEARDFVAYYAARGFNWFRFFLEQVSWDSHGHVVWPWEGTPEAPVYEGYSLETFRAAEDVIRLLAEHGITASVILLHPMDAPFRTLPEKVDVFKRYLRYAVARLSGFSNVVWNLANEWRLELVLAAADVEALGAYVAEVDPQRRLRAVHHFSRFEFPRAAWVDMSSMQHRGLPAEINRRAVLNRHFGKPVLNEEYGYELDVLGPPNDPVNVRRDTWALAMAGAYATYGDKTKGSKVGAYFSSTLKDSAGAVVPDVLRHLPALMSRVPFWEMAPANEALSGCVREEVFCLARLGEEYLVYMTVGQSVGLDLSHVDAPTLRCEWWNPRTGEVGEAYERPRLPSDRPRGSGGLLQPVVFAPPDYEHDWTLRVTVVQAAGAPGRTAPAVTAPGSTDTGE